MHLLVTRPEPDGEATARQLEKSGHRVHRFPLLSVEFHAEPALTATPGGLMVTSRNGVRALDRWAAARRWRDLPMFAVGDATAGLARRSGFTNVLSGGGDVADLCRLVGAKFDPRDGALIYPAAADRSADLSEMLRPLGIRVTTIEAYVMKAAARLDPATSALLAEGRIEGILVYSRRSAEVLADLVDKAGLAGNLGRTTFYVLSIGVGESLRAMGGMAIRVAEQPDEASLIALLDDAI